MSKENETMKVLCEKTGFTFIPSANVEMREAYLNL
jgi:hypothetical protein